MRIKKMRLRSHTKRKDLIPGTKIEKAKIIQFKKGEISMNRVVTTNSLFQTKKDINQLTPMERREYINTLTKEFMGSAKTLLESLKDK